MKYTLLLLVLLLALAATAHAASSHLECAVRSHPAQPLTFSMGNCNLASADIACYCADSTTACEPYTVLKHYRCVDDDTAQLYPPSQYSSSCQLALNKITTQFPCTITKPSAIPPTTVKNIAITGIDGEDLTAPRSSSIIPGFTTINIAFDYTGDANALVEVYLDSLATGTNKFRIASAPASRVNGRVEIQLDKLDAAYFTQWQTLFTIFQRKSTSLKFNIFIRKDGRDIVTATSGVTVVQPYCSLAPEQYTNPAYGGVAQCNGAGKCLQEYHQECGCDADIVDLWEDPLVMDLFTPAAQSTCHCPMGTTTNGTCLALTTCPTSNIDCQNGGVHLFTNGECFATCDCVEPYSGERCQKFDPVCGDTYQTSFFDPSLPNTSGLNDAEDACECSVGFTGNTCRCDGVKTIISFNSTINHNKDVQIQYLLATQLQFSPSDVVVELFDTWYAKNALNITVPYNFTIPDDQDPYTVAVVTIAACVQEAQTAAASKNIKTPSATPFGGLTASIQPENDFSPIFVRNSVNTHLTTAALQKNSDLAIAVGTTVAATSGACSTADCSDYSIVDGDIAPEEDNGRQSGKQEAYAIAVIIVVVSLCVIAILFIVCVIIDSKRRANKHRLAKPAEKAPEAQPAEECEMIVVVNPEVQKQKDEADKKKQQQQQEAAEQKRQQQLQKRQQQEQEQEAAKKREQEAAAKQQQQQYDDDEEEEVETKAKALSVDVDEMSKDSNTPATTTTTTTTTTNVFVATSPSHQPPQQEFSNDSNNPRNSPQPPPRDKKKSKKQARRGDAELNLYDE